MASSDLSYYVTAATTPVDESLAGLQTTVASVLVDDPSAVFGLVALACGTCCAKIDAALAAIVDLLRALDAPVAPKSTAGDPKKAAAAQAHITIAATEGATAARDRRMGLAAGALRDFARSTGAAVGGVLGYSAGEVRVLAADALSTADLAWTDALSIQRNLPTVLDTLPSCAALVRSRSVLTAAEAARHLSSGDRAPRAAALTALSAASALGRTRASTSTASWSGVLTPTGPVPAAWVRGTRSAPFSIPAATTLALVLDGTTFSVSLPAATPATLSTGTLPGAGVTFTAGVDDTMKLYVSGVLVTIVFTAGLRSLAQMATQIAAASGVTAAVVGTRIDITTDSRGDAADLVVGDGNANAGLCVAQGATAVGAGVPVADIAQAVQAVGAVAQVRSLLSVRGRFAFTADGSETVTGTVPTGCVVGDTVVASSATGIARTYKVVTVADGGLELDRSVPAGGYSSTVLSELLEIRSQRTTYGSEVSVLGAVSSLGLTPQTVKPGTKKYVPSPAVVIRTVHQGDRVVAGSRTAAVVSWGSGAVVLDTELPETAASVFVQGESSYATLCASLATWTGASTSWSALRPLIDELPAKAPRARSLVSTLVQAAQGLRAIVAAFRATPAPTLAAVVTQVRLSGFDRALDLLLGGDLAAFMGVTEDTATYADDLSSALVDAGSSLPPSRVDLTDLVENRGRAPTFVADEEDEPNDDVIELEDESADLVY